MLLEKNLYTGYEHQITTVGPNGIIAPRGAKGKLLTSLCVLTHITSNAVKMVKQLSFLNTINYVL